MVPVGLLFIGLLIRTVFAVIIVALAIWLVLKAGRLADAYTERIKSQSGRTTK